MLTLVEAKNSQGDILELPLEDISSGIIVEEIRGLDPVKATLVSSSFATIDGALYQSSRREPRNVVITLGLEPDYVTTSVQDLRNQLYKFFMPKSEVELFFYLGEELVVHIFGRVESFESQLFVKEPVVDISIMCFDPDFLETTETSVGAVTVEDTTEELIEYEGTTETGFVFVLFVDRVLTEFTLYNRLPDGTIDTLDISANLESGDVVTISTVVGDKYVHLLRTAVTSSILYAMSPQAKWLELQPGENNFRAYAVGAPIAYSITYTPRYGGL